MNSSHRKAMFANMVTSLIRHGRIRTTLFRAKELRSIADRLVTLAKIDTLHTRRQAFAMLRDSGIVEKLFTKIAPAFAARKGGYTRLFHADVRPGDRSPMAYIEYLSEDLQAFEPVKKADEKTAKDKSAGEGKVEKEKPAAEKKPKAAAPKKEKAPAAKKKAAAPKKKAAEKASAKKKDK